MAARRPRPCDGAARSRRGGGPRWLESSDRRATRVGAPSRRSRIPRGRDDVAWVVGWRRMGPRHAAGWGGGRRRDRGANRCARRSGRPRGPLHVRRFRLSGRFPPSGFTDRPSRAGTRSPRGHPARARRAGGGRRSHRRPGTPAHLEASPSRLVASRIRVHRDEAGRCKRAIPTRSPGRAPFAAGANPSRAPPRAAERSRCAGPYRRQGVGRPTDPRDGRYPRHRSSDRVGPRDC